MRLIAVYRRGQNVAPRQPIAPAPPVTKILPVILFQNVMWENENRQCTTNPVDFIHQSRSQGWQPRERKESSYQLLLLMGAFDIYTLASVSAGVEPTWQICSSWKTEFSVYFCWDHGMGSRFNSNLQHLCIKSGHNSSRTIDDSAI